MNGTKLFALLQLEPCLPCECIHVKDVFCSVPLQYAWIVTSSTGRYGWRHVAGFRHICLLG